MLELSEIVGLPLRTLATVFLEHDTTYLTPLQQGRECLEVLHIRSMCEVGVDVVHSAHYSDCSVYGVHCHRWCMDRVCWASTASMPCYA